MSKIFRQVAVSERLPKDFGYYITDKGESLYSVNNNITNYWTYDIQWWMEEVEVPSDEVIEKEFPILKDISFNHQNAKFRMGAKWMRDLILNKTK